MEPATAGTRPTASAAPFPSPLHLYKEPQSSLPSPYCSPELLLSSTPPPQGNRAGPPPLAADILRRHLCLPSKASGEFLAPSSFFWSSSREVWCTVHPLGRRWRCSSGVPPPSAARRPLHHRAPHLGHVGRPSRDQRSRLIQPPGQNSSYWSTKAATDNSSKEPLSFL
jgi:hypothetical protein